MFEAQKKVVLSENKSIGVGGIMAQIDGGHLFAKALKREGVELKVA